MIGWEDRRASLGASSHQAVAEQISPYVLMGLAAAGQELHIHTLTKIIGTELWFIKEHWRRFTVIFTVINNCKSSLIILNTLDGFQIELMVESHTMIT
jgi:hypothetical protein